ncbi:transposase [Photobacterium pectinilyticum]|uniref:transposase n=1 Tax=Photobacterium pectinilyticum TaxID=2906793 RepID=UPI0035A0D09A
MRGEIRHLAIDATGLKVLGEDEWKAKKHGAEKRLLWRKLHLAVDADTHQVISAELSLSTVTDDEVLPELLKKTHRKIQSISGEGAYDTRLCYQAIKRKQARPLIPPKSGAAYWEEGTRENKLLLANAFMVAMSTGRKRRAITLGRYPKRQCRDINVFLAPT